MMPRVTTFRDKDGRLHYNFSRLTIPFRLMTNVGDWCEVERGPECLAGNVASLCSQYSHMLGRRFKFKDAGNGVFLIKVVNDPVVIKRRRRKK